MPQYLTERNYAEQLLVTKDGIEGVNRVNEEEGVVSLAGKAVAIAVASKSSLPVAVRGPRCNVWCTQLWDLLRP